MLTDERRTAGDLKYLFEAAMDMVGMLPIEARSGERKRVQDARDRLLEALGMATHDDDDEAWQIAESLKCQPTLVAEAA